MRALFHIVACTALMLTLGLVAAGCGTKDDDAASTACEPGFERRDGKCTACPAWTLPKEGGGCGCFEGFEYDAGKSACEPVLPAGACPPDTMPMLGKRECQPVGVAAGAGCAKGFVADGRGGCDVILPKESCPPGRMALPGETTCREVASCGEGKWGDIADEPGAVYVDKGYAGGGSDGSKAKPLTTIQSAIDVAKAGALVAIAGGLYTENLLLTKPVRVRGRCPAKVDIQGTRAGEPTVTVHLNGSVLVQGLGVTGPWIGIGVSRGNVEVADIAAHDLGGRGMVVTGSATAVAVLNVLVERTHDTGIDVFGAKTTVEGAVVRDTRPREPDKNLGGGIAASADPGTKLSAEIVVRGSLVERNFSVGIALFGSKGTIEATVVRDTNPRSSDKKYGRGISAEVDPDTERGAELIVRGALVAQNHETGIVVLGSRATIDATVVRDTKSQQSDRTFGRGIAAGADRATKLRSELFLRGSVVDRNRFDGIAVSGSKATIEATTVRDTQPQEADQQFGRGIDVVADPLTATAAEVVVRGALIERNREFGIGVLGSTVTVETSVVRDTMPRNSDKLYGDGIVVVGQGYGSFPLPPALVTIRRSRVSSSSRVGVVAFGGASAALQSTQLSCNVIDLAKVAGAVAAIMFEPRIDTGAGGNACGCAAAGGCRVESKDTMQLPPPGLSPFP